MRAILIITAFTVAATVLPAQAQYYNPTLQERDALLQQEIDAQNRIRNEENRIRSQLSSLESAYQSARSNAQNVCYNANYTRRDCKIARLQEEQALLRFEDFKQRIGGSSGSYQYPRQDYSYRQPNIFVMPRQNYYGGNSRQQMFEAGMQLVEKGFEFLERNAERNRSASQGGGIRVKGYGPPADLALDVSPPEEAFSEATPTRPRKGKIRQGQTYAKAETGLGTDYFPPRPDSDTKTLVIKDKAVAAEMARIKVVPIPEAKPVQTAEMVVVDTKSSLAEPVKDSDNIVKTPSAEATITLDSKKEEPVEKPVRIINDPKLTTLPPVVDMQKPFFTLKQEDIVRVAIIVVLLMLVGLLFALGLRGPRRRTEPLVRQPLTPAQNQALERELETTQLEAQVRSDEMVQEVKAEEAVAAEVVAATPPATTTTVQKPKRVRKASTTPRVRKTKADLVAENEALRKGLWGLSVMLQPHDKKLLPPPEKMSKLPAT